MRTKILMVASSLTLGLAGMLVVESGNGQVRFEPVDDELWGLAQLHILRLPQLWTSADVTRSVLFFLGFLLIDVFTCVLAFVLGRKEDWSLLVPVLLQRFYYRQMMYVVLFRSVKEAVSGRPVGWRGVEREVPRKVAHA